MKPLSCVLMLMIFAMAGCSSHSAKSLIGNAVGNAADTKVGYNKHQCFKVQSECVQGHYEEWRTSDGVPGCSCKKL